MSRIRPFIPIALGACLLVAVFLSPLASSAPDGLERVAGDQGFLGQAAAAPAWTHSPLPDYSVPIVRRSPLSTALAGAAGTLIVFGLALALGRLRSGRRSGGDRGPAAEEASHPR